MTTEIEEIVRRTAKKAVKQIKANAKDQALKIRKLKIFRAAQQHLSSLEDEEAARLNRYKSHRYKG